VPNDLEQRLEAVERRVNNISEAVEGIEAHLFPFRASPFRRTPPPEVTPSSPPPGPPPPNAVAPSRAPQKPWTEQLEEVLGGRLLAWAGGIAVVLGVAFFVAMAIKRGWIDEQTRILLSFLGAFALGCTGVGLYERQGHTQAAMAMVGTSIGALFMTLTAATQLYDLIAVSPALAIAFAIGAAATAVAVRWDSPVIAGLGIVGALLAPVLVGADMTSASLTFVLIALASSVGVLLWRRWDWLAVAGFVVSAPQLLDWAFDSPALAGLVVALTVFWLLHVAASLGFELRVGEGLRASSALLLTANAGMGALAYAAFQDIDQGTAADIWISSMAAIHLGAGLAALVTKRVAREIGVLAVALGVLLADLALGLIVNGPALAAAWAGGALVFALMGREEVGGIDLRRIALVWQLVLASVHVFVLDASPETLVLGTDHMVGGILVLAGVAAAFIGCARLLPDSEHHLMNALDAGGLTILAYLAVFALSGVVLVATLAGAALMLALAGGKINKHAPYGVTALIGVALGHVFAIEAEPESLVYGVDNIRNAMLAIGVLAIAAFGISLTGIGDDDPRLRLAFEVLGGLLLVYIGSVAIIDAFQPDSVLDTGLDAEVRQRGQAIMSAFWGLAGLTTLLAGLVRTSRALRLAGFTLLALALGKVFMYDLSTLEAIWRVLSFVALGLLLLAGALAYQWMSPSEDSELSENGAKA
jgi:uncharacterized membrane protein